MRGGDLRGQREETKVKATNTSGRGGAPVPRDCNTSSLTSVSLLWLSFSLEFFRLFTDWRKKTKKLQ